MSPSRGSSTSIVRRLSAASLAAFLVSPTATFAQGSTTRGLSIGAHLMGTSLEVENGDRSGGGGFGVRVGYGFNRIITGFVHVDGSRVEVEEGQRVGGQWDLSHAELGARFHLANSLRRWVPYVEVSAGGRAVKVADAQVNGQDAGDISFSGPAVTFGGGLSAYFTRRFALDISLKVTGGQFSKVDVGPVSVNNLDIDAASARFGVGFVWWPKA